MSKFDEAQKEVGAAKLRWMNAAFTNARQIAASEMIADELRLLRALAQDRAESKA